MSLPAVSVIMAVYNGSPHLRASIESILGQTLSDFELLIVDDGSTDGSEDTVDEFANRDERIRVFHQSNQGPAVARNRALSHASGQYIAIMDADDISLPSRLEQQFQFLEENPDVGVAGSYVETINEDGESMGIWKGPTDHEVIAWRLLFNACMIHSSVMMRHSLLEKVGGYAEWAVYSHDHELWTRAVMKSQLVNLHSVLVKFRLTDSSITVTRRREQMEFSCESAANLHRVLLGDLVDEDIAHFLVWLHQFDLDTAIRETGVEDFHSVFEYLRALYRAHVERFCKEGLRVQVRREVLPRLDLMAEEIAKSEGWGTGMWHKTRARLMPPIQEAIPWMWRAAQDRLSSTSGSDL
jgi:glycosyltransferase involved in cell wall biosynthesis